MLKDDPAFRHRVRKPPKNAPEHWRVVCPSSAYNESDIAAIAGSLGVPVEKVCTHVNLLERAAAGLRDDMRTLDCDPHNCAPSEVIRYIKTLQTACNRLDEAISGSVDKKHAHAARLIRQADYELNECPLSELNGTDAIRYVSRIVENAVHLAESEAVTPASHGQIVDDWLARILGAYSCISGSEPRTSYFNDTSEKRAEAGGPLIRFLAASWPPAFSSLPDRARVKLKRWETLSPDAWRARVRGLLEASQDS